MRTTPVTRSDQPAAAASFLMYLLPVVLFSLLAVATNADAQTILNVERLQPGDVDGWHWGLEGEFSLSRGNSRPPQGVRRSDVVFTTGFAFRVR